MSLTWSASLALVISIVLLFAKPWRQSMLQLVSFYYHLEFHIFHSPTATAPKSLGRRWRLGGLRQQLGQQARPYQHKAQAEGQGAVLGRRTI